MDRKRRTKLEIGIVAEVPTSRGLGYIQYTHWNELMGALVRVLPGLHQSRPTDLEAVVRRQEAYVTFVPLREAINAGLFELVGRAEVPKAAREFPLFRAAGARLPGQSEPRTWWLWDGQKERNVGKLSPEQMKLPIRSTLMPPVLIARVEAQWRPGEPEPAAVARPEERAVHPGQAARHYLYFPDEEAARRAAAAIADDGLQPVVELTAVGDDWLVRVSGGRSEFEEATKHLERVAKDFGGHYDGWESG